jgi:ketosteroid isomerase-like protein
MSDAHIAELEAIEEVRARAVVERDLETLEVITGDDYVHVESGGMLRTKADFLAALHTGTRRFSRYETSERRIRLYGDVAVVHGVVENSLVTPDGASTPKRVRFVRVWVRDDGGAWRNVSHLATELPPLAAP